MRVFVTGTGRCGTKTFSMACRHITNYTSGHETYAHQVRVPDYPDNHIEVDPHISTILPLLIGEYPTALYVHLMRNKEKCVRSLAKRASLAKWASFHFQARPDEFDWHEAAALQYDVTNAAIHLALTHVNNVFTFGLGNAKMLWPIFWEMAKAEGDYEKSLKEFEVRYNASKD